VETRDHLKLLGVFYYVIALLAIPMLLMLVFQEWIFDWMTNEARAQGIDAPFQLYFRLAQGAFALMAIVHLVAGIYIGNCFRRQKHHTLCIVAAAIVCLSFPLGTVLGVFSLIVLMKPEAKAIFGVRS